MVSLHLTVADLDYAVRGHTLLRDINFTSDADACTALLGANGAGKTTLLRLCHGLIEPSGGDIRWGDASPRDLGGRIAMVFQRPRLLRRSAYANVDYVLRLHGFSDEERRRCITEAFRLVGLEHRATHQAHLLSGGEQQRLAVARACALSPDVILMDEPTGRLDMESTERVEDAIRSLKRAGTKIIFTSHNLSQVRQLCDDVIFLDRGCLIAHAACEEFFSSTGNKTICDFLRLQAAF